MSTIMMVALVFGTVGYFFGYLMGNNDGVNSRRESKDD